MSLRRKSTTCGQNEESGSGHDEWPAECTSVDKEHVRWKGTSGRMVGGKEDEVADEEYNVWSARM